MELILNYFKKVFVVFGSTIPAVDRHGTRLDELLSGTSGHVRVDEHQDGCV